MSPAEERLRLVPWAALHGLGATLAPALDAVLAGQPAADVLDRLLRHHRSFSADQRRVCAEALFGVGLWRRRLRHHAGPDAPPLVLLGVLARDLGGAASAPLDVTLPPPRPPPDDWRDRFSLPDWLADELLLAPGPDDAAALAETLARPGPITVRANRLRCDRERLQQRLAEEGRNTTPARFAPDALHLTTTPANLTATQAWRDGWFELQDEGSQLLAECVPVEPGDTVLDLCAGAGGKTLALASRCPHATLHAFDVDLARLERLRLRASRAGVAVRLHHALPDDLRAHHVLVDAPCSELGPLRRGPDLRWRIDPASFSGLPALQLQLLHTAARHCLPGGTITYATCTFRAEENSDVVTAFLARRPDFHRERPRLADGLLDRDVVRLWPHRHGTDGFFAAVLRAAR